MFHTATRETRHGGRTLNIRHIFAEAQERAEDGSDDEPVH